MVSERIWAAIVAQPFTAGGTTLGVATIASTLGYKVNMVATLRHPTNGVMQVIVASVPSTTQLQLAPVTPTPGPFDISAWDTLTTIEAPQQPRPTIPQSDIARAVYEEAPTVAMRSHLVDEDGDHVNASNPLPVTGTLSVSTTGLATSAKQDTGNTSLASIDSKLTDTANGLKVDNSGVTQPVSGTFWQSTQPVTNVKGYATRIDDYTTANVTYVGKAAPGSLTSAAVWQIQKIDATTGTVITWAAGSDAFNQVWDNHATTISYS